MQFNVRRPKHHSYYRFHSKLNLYTNIGIFIISIIIIGSLIDFINNNKFIIVPLMFIILVFIVGYKPILRAIKRYIDYKQFGGVNISKIQLKALMRSLSPRQFEAFCAELFRALGNNVYLTAEAYDGGKDVIVNKRIYVECKRYNTALIGREICQKLLGAVEADGMEKGIVFTNGQIHENAREMLRKTKRLEIWNEDKIFEVYNSLENYQASLVLDTALKYKEETEFKDFNPQTN